MNPQRKSCGFEISVYVWTGPKKCLPKGRQRDFHLLFKLSRIGEVLEAPRAGGPVHSKSGIIKTSQRILVLMSSGKYKRNLFYNVKQYFGNLKQVKPFLKPA